jgi:mono/diheme cytochrome c family protein
MKLKSLLSLFFVAIFALSMVSCGGGTTTTNTDKNENTSNTEVKKDFTAGKTIYETKGTCQTCHQADGKGIAGTFPPLAGSDYLLADKNRAVKQAMYGSQEPITVNGTTYPGKVMTTVDLTDQEVVDVVNYVLNSWGNNGGTVTIADVKANRK